MNELQDTPLNGFTLKVTVAEHKIEGSKNIITISISFTAQILIKI
jgi:hypothetical protein